MRPILLSCALLAVLALPAAAAARAGGQTRPGYVVVRKAAGDGGVNGHAIVTVVVHGFVLGSVSPHDEAKVDIYQLPSPGGQGAPQTTAGVSKTAIKSPRGLAGHEFSGSGFRFRATGGYYRVVVRGSGVYLYVGGVGNVTLHGSSFDRQGDGTYSIDGRAFRSLPTQRLTRQIGRG
jgi:hypothetical protein